MEMFCVLAILFLLNFYCYKKVGLKENLLNAFILFIGFAVCNIISFIFLIVYFIIILIFRNKLIISNEEEIIIKNLIINIVIISILVLLTNIIIANSTSLSLDGFIEYFGNISYNIQCVIPFDIVMVLKISLSVIFLHNPANLIIKTFINRIPKDDKVTSNDENIENNETIQNSESVENTNEPVVKKEVINEVKEIELGRLIGTLERILTLILLVIGQYVLVGLVLTAKSIARYDKIVKTENFAERYLLGTLASLLIVIVTYCVVFLL